MGFQDAETWRPSAEAALEAAQFGVIPRIGVTPVRVRDYQAVSSPRNLPIRGVSDSTSQRAQAEDLAETSTSSPRILPIRGVSESGGETAQARERYLFFDSLV
jgi:hypothetical protein